MHSDEQIHFKKTKKLSVSDEKWNSNWEVVADLLGCQGLFPIEVMKKLDILMWCVRKKVVKLVELTVLHENNIDAT